MIKISTIETVSVLFDGHLRTYEEKIADDLTSNSFFRVFHNVYKRPNTMICTPKQSILYPRDFLGQYYCFHHDARQIHY